MNRFKKIISPENFREDFHKIRYLDKTKNPSSLDEGFLKERRRHTLPQIAVPSAQAGLTSLFGMGRGEPRRNNHLKVVVTWGNF
jgi:hypothetical protein